MTDRVARGRWRARWSIRWRLLPLVWVPAALAVAEASPETGPQENVSSAVSPEPVPRRAAPRFDTETETTYRQVTWDDFQAKPSRFEGEQARISTAIKSDPFDLKVRLINRGSPGGGQMEHLWVALPLNVAFYAAMDKQKSGVGKAARTNLLLVHEQGHFDLTEIAARRLSRSLGGVEGQGATGSEARANVLERIQRAYDRATVELEELQARYDLETRHGQSVRDQRDWNEQIERMFAGEASTFGVEGFESGDVSAGSSSQG